MAQISLKNVRVQFPIHNSSTLSLQHHIWSAVGGKIQEHKKCLIVESLDIKELDINAGDRVGVIGHNGAGKTTLLRVLAGVYKPVTGVVAINGKISSYTDITLGMDPEASGYDNIRFRLIYMGLSFAEVKRLSPSIEQFSELGEFLKLPVRTYSAGMFLRLAFSIATSVDPDIVIMDEMIGGGDLDFKEKAQKRLSGILDLAKILIIATHDIDIIKRFCNKVIWLDRGKLKMIGTPDDVLRLYSS